MKVFHITVGAGVGGTWAQFERLATVLHGAGVTQRIICSTASAQAARLKSAGVEAITMELPGTFAFLDKRKINAELKRFTPDIVMSWSSEASALIEPGGYVHVGRAPLVFDAPKLATCNALIAPSQARADAAIAAGRLASDLHVLPNLPSTTIHSGAAAPFDRKKAFTPATARLVFTALRLDESKGLADLFTAMTQLSGLYLWVAGEGAHREKLEEKAYTLGIKPRVRFLGWQDDLRPYFAAADVCVCPARQEDLGDAVIEAWAAGIPLVATDSLGPGLLVRHQENALLVPVGDARALSDAIKFVLVEKDAAAAMTAAGRAAYEASFTPERLTAQYLALLNKLTSQS
jgi:glycosyltransferase involved in cell wall biosynthesis